MIVTTYGRIVFLDIRPEICSTFSEEMPIYPEEANWAIVEFYDPRTEHKHHQAFRIDAAWHCSAEMRVRLRCNTRIPFPFRRWVLEKPPMHHELPHLTSDIV